MSIKSQKELDFFKSLPKDAAKILDIIEKIQDHTANLRKQIMSELRPTSNIIHLKLNDIDS